MANAKASPTDRIHAIPDAVSLCHLLTRLKHFAVILKATTMPNETPIVIGEEFSLGNRRYRCTDVGTRVIVGIRIDQVTYVDGNEPNVPRVLTQAEADARGWFNGPPYALAEHVFDEEDQKKINDEQ